LEMSRQRLRPGMLEGSTKSCPMCTGTGIVRSVESVALDILRSIEDRLITDGVVPLVATTAVEVALYILNQKRAHLKDIEARYRIPITVTADEDMHISQFVIERGAEGAVIDGESTVVHMDWAHHRELPAPAPQAGAAQPQAHAGAAEGEGEQRRGRGRRRRRKRHPEGGGEGHRPHFAEREPREAHAAEDEEVIEAGAEEARVSEARTPEAGDEGTGQQRKGPRRRGRRGGRRGRGPRQERAPGEIGAQAEPREAQGEQAMREPSRHEAPSHFVSAEAREERYNGDARETRPRAEETFAREAPSPVRRETEPFSRGAASAREEPAPQPAVSPPAEAEQPSGPPRKGWWRR
jgi:ribonuclease E